MDVSAEGRAYVHPSSTVHFDSSSHQIQRYPPTLWRVIFLLWSPIQTLITSENAFTDTLVQFSSVVQSCLTLCDPMVCSTPGLPVHHYFKSWKRMLWKCCTQYASKFGKLSSGHRTGKGQFSCQSQRNAMPKNAHTTAQLYSSHMLIK